jgi:hypothetical protein
MKKIILLCVFALIFSGCAVNKMEAQIYPGKSLEGRENYHGVKLEQDERGVDQLIVDKLISLGFNATSGTQDDVADQVDTLVTYVDKWMWDITMYMLELTIIMREPESNMPVSRGYSIHTSLTRKSPEEMVDEVVTNIFDSEEPK